MEPTELFLPKKHLSWSAMNLWMQNPKQFKIQYFEDGKKFDSKFLAFGKSVAEAIENGTHKQLLPDLEVYAEVEYKMEIAVRGVPLLSYIDSYDPIRNIFREYKTGTKRNPWTRSKVQKHGQLLFYAVGLRAVHGTMPTHCHLDWIVTDDVSEDEETCWNKGKKELRIIGDIFSFEREFDSEELDWMEGEIVRVASEISKAYKEFLDQI